jgi:hypothetical protein
MSEGRLEHHHGQESQPCLTCRHAESLARFGAGQVYGPDGLGKLAKGGHPRRRLAAAAAAAAADDAQVSLRGRVREGAEQRAAEGLASAGQQRGERERGVGGAEAGGMASSAAELLPRRERSAGAAGKGLGRLAALRPAGEQRAAAERSAGRADAEPGGFELLRPFEALPAQGQGDGGAAAGAGGGAAGARRAGLREVGGLRGANEVALDMAAMKGSRGDSGRARLDAENPGKGGELRQGAGARQQGAAVDASAVAGFTDARGAIGAGGGAAEKGAAGFGGGSAAGASVDAAACITDYNPVTPKEYQEVRARRDITWHGKPTLALAAAIVQARHGRAASRRASHPPPLGPVEGQGCRGAARSPRAPPGSCGARHQGWGWCNVGPQLPCAPPGRCAARRGAARAQVLVCWLATLLVLAEYVAAHPTLNLSRPSPTPGELRKPRRGARAQVVVRWLATLLVLAEHLAANPAASAAADTAGQDGLPLPQTPPTKQDLALKGETGVAERLTSPPQSAPPAGATAEPAASSRGRMHPKPYHIPTRKARSKLGGVQPSVWSGGGAPPALCCAVFGFQDVCLPPTCMHLLLSPWVRAMQTRPCRPRRSATGCRPTTRCRCCRASPTSCSPRRWAERLIK